jgi:hypothetical protein
MEPVVACMDVLWVGKVVAIEVDKISANVAVPDKDVFKIFDTVIVARGGDIVLEYDMVV